MNTSTRSKVICALAVGLLLLCLNTLIMAINTKFASQTGSNDTQFSVGIDIVPFALISVKNFFLLSVYVVKEYLEEIGGFKYLILDRRGMLSYANFLEYLVGLLHFFLSFCARKLLAWLS